MFQLEQEIGKVHHAHEELVQSSERRERLERAARARLQSDVRRLQELNRALREQVELLSAQLLAGRTQNQSDLPDMAAENLRKELGKREIFIAQLITQSKLWFTSSERVIDSPSSVRNPDLSEILKINFLGWVGKCKCVV